jgi:predicted phage tail protein
MTIINLHGILAREFGKAFTMHLSKPKHVIDAIDSNNPTFKKRILELSNQGIHYRILIDGESVSNLEQLNIQKTITNIDLAPMIGGSGPILIPIIDSMLPSAAGAALVTAAGTLTTLGTVLSTGLSIIAATLIQNALAPSPDNQKTESSISAAQKSFVLGSKANTTQQGVPVPVGYGRLRVGSLIIQTTVKSYPQSQQVKATLAGRDQSNVADIALKEQRPIK